MFSLLDAAWKQLYQVQQHTTILLGPSNAGKTTILERLKILFAETENHKQLPKVRPTIGLNVANLKVSSTYFLLWDFGGKESLRPIWEKYVTDAETVVYVIDSSSEETVNDSKKLLKELLERTDLVKVPFLIYVNKQDLPGALSLLQVVDKLDLPFEVDRLRWFQNCSAIQGYGIKEGFEWLERHLVAKPQKLSDHNIVKVAKPKPSYLSEQ
ncbi:ADP-ribosylation factor-related protein 1 [Galdieria sulphuraria]|uniref:ADP-ribosylation factor n=2 Tax=Galdieria sulphuraria TaxID=130081 RepID=M2VRX5_GALSU|nr:ADP-ribosylation factor [Galdieria sulphuraria]EME25841.1 ADP-ribosylation factor [Galdieria sulphuraria]GJD09985.1 ADP-ribosylation factor-related protein 1 [Galdieria sulphuraria]|eukprot:XP_005702361.1 ADP-ribosylation factor [Galdieria sulphuraria]